jgi:hypothetical protein
MNHDLNNESWNHLNKNGSTWCREMNQ